LVFFYNLFVPPCGAVLFVNSGHDTVSSTSLKGLALFVNQQVLLMKKHTLLVLDLRNWFLAQQEFNVF